MCSTGNHRPSPTCATPFGRQPLGRRFESCLETCSHSLSTRVPPHPDVNAALHCLGRYALPPVRARVRQPATIQAHAPRVSEFLSRIAACESRYVMH
jgi:hypothetical protein